jgi:hypothetical protein
MRKGSHLKQLQTHNQCMGCGVKTYHMSGKCKECRSFKCVCCGKKVTHYNVAQKRDKCAICYVESGDQYRHKMAQRMSQEVRDSIC